MSSWLVIDLLSFLGVLSNGCFFLGGAGILGLAPSFPPGQLSIEFVNVGGWLTNGDPALDSCAHFLAVAEHRLIPSRARSMCHQLRRLVIILCGLLLARIMFLVVMLGSELFVLVVPPLLSLLRYSSVSGIFQVGSCFENHSSHWKRRSGSSF